MRELSKQDIKTIDDYLLEYKVKHLDVRSELIDHLATELENQSKNVSIEDFLKTRVNFVKGFANAYQKNIHWTYQKQIWIEWAKFFYKPNYILASITLITTGYILLSYLGVKSFNFTCFFILMALIIYPIFYQIKYSSAAKQIQSMQSLLSVSALPSVFLYTFSAVKDELIENLVLSVIYFGVSIFLGISSVITIEKNKKRVLQKYHQIIG